MSAHPWLSSYDAGVARSLAPYPERTLVDVVRETARRRPVHPALLFKGARLTYAELERQSDAVAAALASLGVRKGDRVALIMPNCPQAIITQLGAWKAGAVVSPLNPLYTEHELAHALGESGAEIAVVLTPFYERVKALQPRTALRRIVATSIKEHLPPLLRVAFTLFRERKDGHRVTLRDGDLRLSDLARRFAGDPPPAVRVMPDDPALLLFTGGTTGLPKAALGVHQGLLATGMQLHAWFSPVLDDETDVILGTFPVFHVAGSVAMMAAAYVGRNPVALVPNPRDLKDVIATIRREKPAFLPAVPTLLTALLAHPDVQAGRAGLDSLKLAIAGAAPLPAETKRRFEATTGARVVEIYAMTETMAAALGTPVHGTYKEGAAGVPLPDVEVRIADAETGEGSLPAGEVGEILMRAPQLMREYWNHPAETAESLRDGWLRTGDLGVMDADGYVSIVDRKKDLIKSSGFQVWPREVEEAIATHPAVQEVAVAGVPDEYQGEAVQAWVVLRAGQRASADEIRAHVRERLVSYKAPKHVEFREALPKSTVGKVLRRELTQGARQAQPAAS